MLSSNLLAQGFWDQGLISGHVRTDYNHPSRGSFGLPISFTYPSPYFLPCTENACGYNPRTYAQSNAYSNGNFWASNYWVLSFNNEIAYHNRDGAPHINNQPHANIRALTHNPGPPNQSLPRSLPGQGVMGFRVFKNTDAGENYNRAHMVLNMTFPNPQPAATPYFGIGAQVNRGNGTMLGHLNGAWWQKDHVSFTARVYDIGYPTPVGTQPESLASYIAIMSQWAGKQRLLFIHLFHYNNDVSDNAGDVGNNLRWNWPIQQSFYYPGADIAYMDAEHIQQYCGIYVPELLYIGDEYPYNLDLTALFQCASGNNTENTNLFDVPMPPGPHPIKGVHWAVEGTGVNGWLWVAVHDMKML